MKNNIKSLLSSLAGIFLIFGFVPSAQGAMTTYEALLFHTKRNHYLQKHWPGFLAPVSVGRVKKVLSPTTFQLENGIKIKILGIDDPLLSGTSTVHQCFAEAMKNYLTTKLRGRIVILRRDRTDFDADRYLLRYVYLPGWDKHEKETFFTHKMIKDGYGKAFFEGKNKQYKDYFDQLTQEIYVNPRGAWGDCL
ncbi:MAG TPA: thermonuclease family protein [Candidatus Gracilibacteria bacterium]